MRFPLPRRVVAIALVTTALGIITNAQEQGLSARRDSRWWRSLASMPGAPPEGLKAFHALGILDGLGTGVFVVGVAATGEERAATLARQRRYREVYGRVAGKVTALALARGIDAVYEDTKNADVRVNVAAFAVLMRLSGAPEAMIEQLLTQGRIDGATP
jgi:hypothetical protein